MKNKIILVLIAGILSACGSDRKDSDMSERRRAHEAKGRVLLDKARQALVREQYSEARRAIRTLRDSFPLALSARTEGILLDDSISLGEARRQLGAVPADSVEMLQELALKVKFYTRKLEHDKKADAGRIQP